MDWTNGSRIRPVREITLGDGCRTSGGSATARKLFLAAAASQDSFTIENSDNCPTIAFAQIEPIELYVDAANARHNVWNLRIDFADFDSLRGDHQALAAFDPAIGVLHELAHGVLNYFDPIDANDQIGECETFINQVRAELGLPLRQNYYPRGRLATRPERSTQMLQGEFTFVNSNANTEGVKEFLVTFDIKKVFDVTRAKSRDENQAALRKRLWQGSRVTAADYRSQ